MSDQHIADPRSFAPKKKNPYCCTHFFLRIRKKKKNVSHLMRDCE